MSYDEYEYELVAAGDMDEYWMDENKYSQLPWEDLRQGQDIEQKKQLKLIHTRVVVYIIDLSVLKGQLSNMDMYGLGRNMYSQFPCEDLGLR